MSRRKHRERPKSRITKQAGGALAYLHSMAGGRPMWGLEVGAARYTRGDARRIADQLGGTDDLRGRTG